MPDVSILVRCWEMNRLTEKTITSIQCTGRSNYELIVEPNKASASINSNILIEKATTKKIILMDDDLQMKTDGWDVLLLETLEK